MAKRMKPVVEEEAPPNFLPGALYEVIDDCWAGGYLAKGDKSRINPRRAKELTEAGKIKPAGG